MKYRNKKNKKVYTLINKSTIDATNGQESKEPLVLYEDEEGRTFVRDQMEFRIKFDKIYE